MFSIYEFVKEQRDSYRSDSIEITPGFEFNQYETLRTIELYHNSKFLTGNTDSQGREKPFYNVCKFRVNVATRATDLDTKDVTIQSERTGGYAQSFLLTLKNRNWMQESRFGVFLNKMGHTRAKYGGVLVKRTERDGELALHVMRWRDMITDQVDIRSGVKIERHYYTPAELKTEAPENWENIDDAISAAKKEKSPEATERGTKNKTPGGYIEVYEVHGVLPTCFLAGTSEKYPDDYGSETEYARQMHVVVLDESESAATKGVTLFGGIEEEDPYKYLPWEEVDGRGLGVGVVEDLFEAQVWTNDTIKDKRDLLKLAAKMLLQTTDGNIAAANILTDVENGHIFKLAPNTTMAAVNNGPALSSLPALTQLIDEWNTQAERIASTPAALTGEDMPSGQPFRLAAMLNREAGSMFVYRTQEAGLFIQEIYTDWVLPFLVTEIKKDKELVADLEHDELEMVATQLGKHEQFMFAKEKILSDGLVTNEELQAVFDTVRNSNLTAGKRRAFEIIEDMFKDWQGKVTVITTGEQKNKTAFLETLFNVFQVVAKNPQLLQDPVLKRLFNQIVETAGVSPLLLDAGQQQTAAPVAPAQGLPEQIGSAATPAV